MTVFAWGVYGILLGLGRINLLSDAAGKADAPNAGLKAFLVVGVAYFVVAIIGPGLVLMLSKTNWSFTKGGIYWSFAGGAAGAIGAFTLILALGAGHAKFGSAVALTVMPIVFCGAPIVNSIVGMIKDRIFSIPLPFVIGILMASTGTYLVAKFAPQAAPPAGRSGSCSPGCSGQSGKLGDFLHCLSESAL